MDLLLSPAAPKARDGDIEMSDMCISLKLQVCAPCHGVCCIVFNIDGILKLVMVAQTGPVDT